MLAREHDRYRAACILEPRGSDVLVGPLLLEPVSVGAVAGVSFFKNAGFRCSFARGPIGIARTSLALYPYHNLRVWIRANLLR
ncbi:hypothetical protein CF645_37515 [Burkholderia pseudomallei]|uniref:proline racemase family protein n=1 Tax=Burkholderia pseudomallei TaxID=28450 RepID=UPI000CCF4C06|nr:hypothetical protein CF645_37510 [Burkholderia pseudomallei]PNX11015.1 hypothetical protein CF645_37515 [Burkholderia pseudomallei]